MVKKWIREHDIECVLLLLLFAKMLSYAAEKGFWYDEIVMLGFISRPKLSDLFQIYSGMEVSNLPLYALFMWVIYHITPPYTVFLVMPGILMTLCAVWMLSCLAKKRMGRAASVTVLLLGLVSVTVVIRISLELRAYCLMFFGVCFVMYVYLTESKRKVRSFILRLIASICLIFSHFYGVLFFAAWGAATLVKCLRKEWHVKRLIPQIIAGLLFLPWFLHIVKRAVGKAGDFWIKKPTLIQIPDVMGYLMGSTLPLLIAYALMCVFVFFHILKEKKLLSSESFCLFTPYAVLLLMFVYSRYFAGGGGLFLNKYFIVVLPCMLYTFAAGVQLSCAFLWKKNHLTALLWMLLLIPAFFISYRQFSCEDRHITYTRYSGWGKILREAGDLSDERTMLFLTYHDGFEGMSILGAYDFYLKRRGTEAANLECFDVHRIEEKMEALDNIDKVYVFSDDDMLEDVGDDYVCTWQDGYYCLTVYEKR